MFRLRCALAVSCVLLVLPAAATARPGQRGFNQTFPVASRLCASVAAGHAPIKLRPVSGQVIALCGTLRTSFTNAQNTYFATVAPLKQQASTVIAQTRLTCRTPGPACRTARQQARTTLQGLRGQVRQAAVAFRQSVQAARTTFWNGIHQLRGGSGLAADNATPNAPLTTLPANP